MLLRVPLIESPRFLGRDTLVLYGDVIECGSQICVARCANVSHIESSAVDVAARRESRDAI